MRILGLSILNQCAETHPEVRGQLHAWRYVVEKANWKTPLDIKARYASASILRGRCVVFNLKGNNYRLIAKVNFELGLLRVLFAGTHSTYNRIRAIELCREDA